MLKRKNPLGEVIEKAITVFHFVVDARQMVVGEEAVENEYIYIKLGNNSSLSKAILIPTLLILIIRGFSS